MRRIALTVLLVILAALIVARATVPEPAAPAMAAVTSWDSGEYNVLEWERSDPSQTAGSSLIAEMDSYFLSCAPTAKNEYTGLLAGKNLILILAEQWRPGELNAAQAPTLYRLWQEGTRFGEVYAPEWYQGRDGREFALLSGLTPTAVRSGTAMVWAGEQGIYLPFALAECLGRAGYACHTWPREDGRDASYEALGFTTAQTTAPDDTGLIEDTLPALTEKGPFFAYYVLAGTDGETALARLWDVMDEAGLTENTAVCLAAGNSSPLRGHLFLWGPGLKGTAVSAPCSELDVTPTLLNLFGADYDARFLSGRDVFAAGPSPDGAGASSPVSLYGSAYSDWVTDAGCYIAGEETFFPADGRFAGAWDEARYVQQVRRQVYDRYIYARRVMESNYFRLVMER